MNVTERPPVLNLEVEMTTRASLAKRIGNRLFGSSSDLFQIIEPTDVGIVDVETDTYYSETTEKSGDIATAYEFVSGLVSDQSILSERVVLEKELVTDSLPDIGSPKTRKYYKIEQKLSATHLEPYARLCLDRADQRSESIVKLLNESPRLKRGTWFEGRATDTRNVLINATDNPVTIPASNIVHASGIDSWQGRGINGTGLKKSQHDSVLRSSADTIRYYAQLGSDAPPVEMASGYIQPNGIIFYSVGSGSHRAAAALLRGDEEVRVSKLSMYLTDENFFDVPQQSHNTEIEPTALH